MRTSIGSQVQHAKRRETNYIVIHHSATKEDSDYDTFSAYRDHTARGFTNIGYHAVVERNGMLRTGRPIDTIGAHAVPHNGHSLGICMMGGISPDGDTEDNFTDEQYITLQALVSVLKVMYPHALVIRHKELSETNTECCEVNLKRLDTTMR